MDTNALKKFAQNARNLLLEQVEVRLTQVLSVGSAARREHPRAVGVLEAAIAARGQQAVVEQVAYTWFNRFSALRFMDMNGYTSTRTVSPADGQTRPELLSEAMAGHIDESVPAATAARVRALLVGASPSDDPQGEAYRLLLVAACNQWHETLPFLFERIDDYTELLMPADLLSASSILARVRDAMDADACQDVEVIGWLYQFYISEKKDQVFAGLKRNIKITAENIPAATQLFTPHWIVRYLVENSLGRLWLLNRPHSTLAQRMDYYIAPVEPEVDFLRIDRPQDIRLCDPACGSGHMLTYAFDLLFAIYEEEGYDADAIPALILTHNLYGVEIDDRAGALAAFALSMKAAARLGRRRFLRLAVQPQICVMEDVRFGPDELRPYMAEVGHDLFTADLRQTLEQFGQARNFGSLIIPALKEGTEVRRVLEARNFEGNLFLHDTHRRVLTVLRMADFLSQEYHVVVANPPYKSKSDLNSALANWIDEIYPRFKFDLYAAFHEKILKITKCGGYCSIVSMQSWLFIESASDMRSHIIGNYSIRLLVQIGLNSFPELNSKVATAAAYIILKQRESTPGIYIDLNSSSSKENKDHVFLYKARSPEFFFRPRSADILSIQSAKVAYQFSSTIIDMYRNGETLLDHFFSDGLTKTGDNDRFLRFFWELPRSKTQNVEEWRVCAKGGKSRNYFGNNEVVVKWTDTARNHYKDDNVARISPEYLWMLNGITWTKISTKMPSFRLLESGTIAETGGPAIFERNSTSADSIYAALGLLCSKLAAYFLNILCPTANMQTNDVLSLPFPRQIPSEAIFTTKIIVQASKDDWNKYETSPSFEVNELIKNNIDGTLQTAFDAVFKDNKAVTERTKDLIENNNRIFIDAYGLQDELTPEVPLDEVTLTCNPAYRYGGNTDAAEREELLRADTVRELISYAVGCMFGRYSLDAPGLILANQGEGLAEYLERVPDPRFPPDRDNVIPALDGDWFADDITERFRLFLRLTFGEERFLDNLAFVEGALGGNLRRYFTRDFFTDHVKRYKKRPIYWLFSSPKGSFQALIYMHRYRPDTVSVMLNDYLREFIRKLTGERARLERLADDPSQPQAKRTKAVKDGAAIAKMIVELTEWERDTIFPLAQQQIEIDLDDGVKANYPKFGPALKKIAGLEATDD